MTFGPFFGRICESNPRLQAAMEPVREAKELILEQAVKRGPFKTGRCSTGRVHTQVKAWGRWRWTHSGLKFPSLLGGILVDEDAPWGPCFGLMRLWLNRNRQTKRSGLKYGPLGPRSETTALFASRRGFPWIHGLWGKMAALYLGINGRPQQCRGKMVVIQSLNKRPFRSSAKFLKASLLRSSYCSSTRQRAGTLQWFLANTKIQTTNFVKYQLLVFGSVYFLVNTPPGLGKLTRK